MCFKFCSSPKTFVPALFALMLSHSPGLVAEAPSPSQRIEATYDLIWNGFHVSTAETIAELGSDSYFLGVRIRTHGLLQLATKGSGDIEVSGQILPGGRVQPRQFSASGMWHGDAFSQKLSFAADGHVDSFESNRPDDWLQKNRRAPVPDALKAGPDPASLFVALLQAPLNFGDTGTAINIRTFDGDSVVDWQMGCAETPVMIKPSSHSSLSGQALECDVGTTLVAGAKLDDDSDKVVRVKRGPGGVKRPVKASDIAEAKTRVWLMAVDGGTRLMPVRAEVPSENGTVDLYLSKLALSDSSGGTGSR